jgi:hypothetical protein
MRIAPLVYIILLSAAFQTPTSAPLHAQTSAHPATTTFPGNSKGLLAALEDTSSTVADEALEALYNGGWLDSLAATGNLSPATYDRCRTQVKADITHASLAVRILLTQKHLSTADDNEIIEFLKCESLFPEDPAVAFSGLGWTPDETLVKAARSAWTEKTPSNKTGNLLILLHQADLPQKDFNLLTDYIRTKYDEDNGVQSDVDQHVANLFNYITRFQLNTGCLTKITATLVEKRNNALIHFVSQELWFRRQLRHYDNPLLKDAELELDKRIKDQVKEQYIELIGSFPNISTPDSIEIGQFVQNSSASSGIRTIEALQQYHKSFAVQLLHDILLKDRTTSRYELYYLDDSIINDTAIRSSLESILIQPDGHSLSTLLLLCRLTKLDKRGLTAIGRILDTIRGPYYIARTELRDNVYLNPDALNVIRSKYGRFSEPELLKLGTYFISEAASLVPADTALLNKSLAQDEIRKFYFWKIFHRHNGQPELIPTIRNYLDYPDLLVRNAEPISDTIWSIVTANIDAGLGYSDWILVNRMPVYCWYQAANKLMGWYGPHDRIRLLLYAHSGGDPALLSLLKWFLHSEHLPDVQSIDPQEARFTLHCIDSMLSSLAPYHQLQKIIAIQTNEIAKTLSPRELIEDSFTISDLYDKFTTVKLSRYVPVLSPQTRPTYSTLDRVLDFAKKNWYYLLIHPIFWIALIFLYPTSKKIQSIFFWNPVVRKWGGLGYVNFFLIHLGYFRNKLLAPFEAKLRESAAAVAVDQPGEYIEASPIIRKNDGLEVNIEFLNQAKGHYIIEGESGAGKTMLLAHIMHQSQRIAAFLKAEHCKTGVIAALTSRLFGIAGETDYIRAILYNGYIDIYIDGLNEVGPDVRAQISEFLTAFDDCRCFISTQPMAWIPPSSTFILELKPLKPSLIGDFLRKKFTETRDRTLNQADYNRTCEVFVEKQVDDAPLPEISSIYLAILSNPLDLTIVAQLIAQGHLSINLLKLQEVYFNQMADYYNSKYKEKADGFPLNRFSEAIFQLRLQDISKLPYADFRDEIDSMYHLKMVVFRIYEDSTKEWYFRHDKIRDFFLLAAFRNEPDRQTKYIADQRFRGVYYLLATYLPIPAAQRLERILVNYMVDTNDDFISKEFIRRLRTRTKLE